MQIKSKRDLKIALVFSPGVNIELSMPPIGIAYLASNLKLNGWLCELFDLNYDLAISCIAPAWQGISRKVFDKMRDAGSFGQETLEEYFLVKMANGRFIEKGTRALLAGKKIYCQEGIALKKFVDARCGVLASFDIVGFSVILPSQVALTRIIAAALRSVNPSIVLIGGGQKATAGDLKGLFDLVVTGDGETSLLKIVEQVSAGRNLSSIRAAGLSTKPPAFTKKLDSFPSPDYRQLFAKYKYLSPEKVIPLALTRGCYWAKCRFCTYGWGSSSDPKFRAPYRRHSVNNILKQIRQMSQIYAARSFFFSVDVIDPGLLSSLAGALLSEGINIRWRTEIRAEQQFLKDGFAEQLYNAGCRVASIGFESACQRVLDAMEKGISVRNSKLIVKRFQAAGISVNLDCFIGFPTETPAEAAQTQSYIRDNGHLNFVNPPGTYVLNSRQPVFEMAKDDASVGLEYDRKESEWRKSGMSWQETRRQSQIGFVNFCCAPGTGFFPERLDGAFFLITEGRGFRQTRLPANAAGGEKFSYIELAFMYPITFSYLLPLLESSTRDCAWTVAKMRSMLSVKKTKSPKVNLYRFFQSLVKAIDSMLPDKNYRQFLREAARFELFTLEACLADTEKIPAIIPEKELRNRPPPQGAANKKRIGVFRINVNALINGTSYQAMPRSPTKWRVVCDINGILELSPCRRSRIKKNPRGSGPH